MKVGAMNKRVRIAKSAAKLLSKRDARDLFGRNTVHYQKAVRKHCLGRDLIGDAEPVEHFEDVGAELNAGSNFLELASLFDQANAISAEA